MIFTFYINYFFTHSTVRLKQMFSSNLITNFFNIIFFSLICFPLPPKQNYSIRKSLTHKSNPKIKKKLTQYFFKKNMYRNENSGFRLNICGNVYIKFSFQVQRTKKKLIAPISLRICYFETHPQFDFHIQPAVNFIYY